MTTNPVIVTRRSAVGLKAPRWLWVILVGGLCGLVVDAFLAKPVMDSAFKQEQDVSWTIAIVIGIVAAAEAIGAAINWNSGRKNLTVGLLLCAIAVGLGMAWARVTYGLGEEVEDVKDHWPGTVLMVALFSLSLLGVYSAALKLFHPARSTLRRSQKELKRINQQRIELEGDLAGIDARIANEPETKKELDQSRSHAMAQVDARGTALKSLARDAMARAVGDPSATPLVRAPHEPQQDSANALSECPEGEEPSTLPTHDALHTVS